MQMQRSACGVDIQNMWNVLLTNFYLCNEVADLITASSEGITMAQFGSLCPANIFIFFLYTLQWLLM